jgi:molybdenum cofactor guanylyltransferase
MTLSAGVVLVGGRSSRMGAAKAGLEWHGSTLLWRTVCVLQRGTGGPIVVVRAPGQDLPPLPPGTEVVADPREGLGPVQGIATGLTALAGRAEVCFVAATDMPFLHPAFVRRTVRAALPGTDVALPFVRGFRQPLAAAYRRSVAPVAEELLASGLLSPPQLFARCEVAVLDEAALLADPALAAVDAALDSIINVNEPADYEAARVRPAAQVTVRVGHGVRRLGAVAEAPRPTQGAGLLETGVGELVRAATVAEAAAAAGIALGSGVTVTLNGELATGDGQLPTVAGDVVLFQIAGAVD